MSGLRCWRKRNHGNPRWLELRIFMSSSTYIFHVSGHIFILCCPHFAPLLCPVFLCVVCPLILSLSSLLGLRSPGPFPVMRMEWAQWAVIPQPPGQQHPGLESPWAGSWHPPPDQLIEEAWSDSFVYSVLWHSPGTREVEGLAALQAFRLQCKHS